MNSLYVLVSIIGLWAGVGVRAGGDTDIVNRNKIQGVNLPHLISLATMLLSVATILGCIVLPPVGGTPGAACDAGDLFCVHAGVDCVGIRYIFYLPVDPLKWFIVCLFFLGLGGANFAMYTLWLPEQYPTECRGSAFAFATSVGDCGGRIYVFSGSGRGALSHYGKPVAFTAIAFAWGLLLLPLGMRQRGKFCPRRNRRGARCIVPLHQIPNKNHASSSTRASPWRALCAAITLSA